MFAYLFTYLLDLYHLDFNQVFLLDEFNFLKVSVVEFIPKNWYNSFLNSIGCSCESRDHSYSLNSHVPWQWGNWIQWVEWRIQGMQPRKEEDKKLTVLNPRPTDFAHLLSLAHPILFAFSCLFWLIYMAAFKPVSVPWLKSKWVLRMKSKGPCSDTAHYTTEKSETAQPNNLT